VAWAGGLAGGSSGSWIYVWTGFRLLDRLRGGGNIVRRGQLLHSNVNEEERTNFLCLLLTPSSLPFNLTSHFFRIILSNLVLSGLVFGLGELGELPTHPCRLRATAGAVWRWSRWPRSCRTKVYAFFTELKVDRR